MSSVVMDSMGVTCSGRPLEAGGGTWKGKPLEDSHVIPGLVFFCWGCYWAVAIFKRHFKSQTSGRAFTSNSWYPCWAAGRWLYALEPFLKVIGGPIGVSIELYFDSIDGFRPLYCSESGRFAAQYAHNYQHASSYPAFLVSGIVDFVGMYIKLPVGTEQVFTALAFGIEGFLMIMHKKHLPVDMITHLLLGCTMLAGFLGIILELRVPHNFLISTFKSFAVAMQGVWLMAMGQMMFTGNEAWSDDYMGPAMLVPPIFAMLLLVTAVGFLVLYVGLDMWQTRCQAYAALPQVQKLEPATIIELPAHDSIQYQDFSLDDSANETSSQDGSDADTLYKPKSIRTFASTAINLLKPCPRQSLGKTPSKSNEHII